ncbi:MAG TPA: sensor histidine kinase [Actinomycetota bacterium]|nr:sensor histidine kinase [Actinomycetota bacterium]
MRPGTARGVAWGAFGTAVASAAGGIAVSVASGAGRGEVGDPVIGLGLLVFGTVGALVASRRPGNAIGWIFVSVALFIGVIGALEGIQDRLAAGGDSWAALGEDASLAARLLAWIGGWAWVPSIFVPTTFPLLLFPDGRLPSRRWRALFWAAAIGLPAFSLSMAFDPSNYGGGRLPLGIRPPGPLVAASGLGSLLLVGGVIGGGAAVVTRLRRSSGEERQQIKWLAYAGVLAAVCLVGSFLTGGILAALGVDAAEGTAVADVLNLVVLVSLLALPIAMGFAILRYRLYDIDLVIRKTVVYGALAAFITLVYVGVVAGIGALIGSRGNVLLSGLAAAVVAVAFQPVRHRAQRLANRLVYGRRATPYEVLAEFSARLAGSYSLDDVLPRMARVLAEGTGAARATIWLRSAQGHRAAATWPAGTHPAPLDPGFEVRHQGEVLGAISVATPPDEPLTPVQEQLIRDVAGQAGLVLRNVRLIEDLRASRQRLVAAQDEERRRLERNIHDGAQQQLVALTVQLRLLEQRIERDPEGAREAAAQLRGAAAEALEDLRDLARGIYPPLLADKGLPAAIEAQARKAPVPVRLQADGVGRYPREAEAAVYFCVLEALQNAAKHAGGSEVRVRLWASEGELAFAVEDDGPGFDPSTTPRGAGLQNMADRIEALGGSLEVRSLPGAGTTVAGRLPTHHSEATP